jgi:O-antigen/teichoic acid export membrane protein
LSDYTRPTRCNDDQTEGPILFGYHYADPGRAPPSQRPVQGGDAVIDVPGSADRSPVTEASEDLGASARFTDRVLVLFSQSVFATAIGIAVGFLNARMLGPGGKGDFYLLTLVPATIVVVLQLGLPQALAFYTARGQVRGIVSMSAYLTVALCVPALIVAGLLIPILQSTVLRGIDQTEILLALIALPLALNATFSTGILLGRQSVQWYSLVNVILSLVAVVLFVVLVGVLQLGVVGALIAFILETSIGTVGWYIGSRRSTAKVAQATSVSYRALFRYGLPYYPGSLTQFFSVRLDVFLLAFMLADPSSPIGWYSMAVTIASLVFFLPNAVSTLFFPHVAGSTRQDSNRQVPMVARVTLLITAAIALALVPVAIVLILVLLPDFQPSLPPLLILLPGVVALSLTKVLSSYVAGVGRTSWTSFVNVSALALNIAVNLALIPAFGILGAATASLISYAYSAVAFSVMASRLGAVTLRTLWIPRTSDVRFTVATSASMARRLLRR